MLVMSFKSFLKKNIKTQNASTESTLFKGKICQGTSLYNFCLVTSLDIFLVTMLSKGISPKVIVLSYNFFSKGSFLYFTQNCYMPSSASGQDESNSAL